MATHEVILLCSSLQGVGRCFFLCFLLGFATFVAFGKFGYPHLRLEACCSMPQRSKFYCLRQVHLAENLPRATHTQNRVETT